MAHSVYTIVLTNNIPVLSYLGLITNLLNSIDKTLKLGKKWSGLREWDNKIIIVINI